MLIRRLQHIWRFLTEFIDAWSVDRVPRQSAAIAYYALFSMAPIVLLIVAVAGHALGQKAFEGQLHAQLEEYMGHRVADALEGLVKGINLGGTSWVTAVVGGATLLFGATGVFVELKDSLNLIWGLHRRDGRGIVLFLLDRLLSFGMVLLVGLLLLLSMLASSVFALVRAWLQPHLQVPVEAWGILGTSISFVVETVMFALIFKVLPDIKFPWKDVWLGALVTALLFEAGKFGLGWYLGRETTVSSFGAAGSVVLLLIWVYWSSMIVLTGAEFIEISQRMRGHPHGRKPAIEDPAAPDRGPV